MDDLNNASFDDITIVDKSKPAASASEEPKDTTPQDGNEPGGGGEPKVDQPGQQGVNDGETPDTGNASEGDNPKEGDEPGDDNNKPDDSGNDFDNQFNSRLSKLTGGQIESWDTMQDIINDYVELSQQREELSKKREIEFPDERSKQAYEFVTSRPGNVEGNAKLFYHVQSLDLEGMNPKEVQFEAFALDPNNADLTREQAREYFEELYESKFDDIEHSKAKEYQHRQETNKAKAQLAEMQKKFNEAPEQKNDDPAQENQLSQDQIDEINRNVENALKNFNGLSIELGENETFNYGVNENSDYGLEEIKKAASDPSYLVQTIVDQYKDDQGNFDYNGYVNHLAAMMNYQALLTESYNHGLKQGKIKHVENHRNPSDINDKGGNAQPPEKSFLETFAEAMGK